MAIEIIKKIGVGILLIVSFILGHNIGYAKGARYGKTIGQIRELLRQGYTIEDALYIIQNRDKDEYIQYEELME